MSVQRNKNAIQDASLSDSDESGKGRKQNMGIKSFFNVIPKPVDNNEIKQNSHETNADAVIPETLTIPATESVSKTMPKKLKKSAKLGKIEADSGLEVIQFTDFAKDTSSADKRVSDNSGTLENAAKPDVDKQCKVRSQHSITNYFALLNSKRAHENSGSRRGGRQQKRKSVGSGKLPVGRKRRKLNVAQSGSDSDWNEFGEQENGVKVSNRGGKPRTFVPKYNRAKSESNRNSADAGDPKTAHKVVDVYDFTSESDWNISETEADKTNLKTDKGKSKGVVRKTKNDRKNCNKSRTLGSTKAKSKSNAKGSVVSSNKETNFTRRDAVSVSDDAKGTRRSPRRGAKLRAASEGVNDVEVFDILSSKPISYKQTNVMDSFGLKVSETRRSRAPVRKCRKKNGEERRRCKEVEPKANCRRSPRIRNLIEKAAVDSDDTGTENEYTASLINEKGGKRCLRIKLTKIIKENGRNKVAKKLIFKAKQRTCRSSGTLKLDTKQSAPAANLASIFVKSNRKRKRKFDTATVERRRHFLMSGIPEKLRMHQKQLDTVKNAVEDASEFPAIRHVLQVDEQAWMWTLSWPDLQLLPEVQWAGAVCGTWRWMSGKDEKLPQQKSKDSDEIQQCPTDVDAILSEMETSYSQVRNLYQSLLNRRNRAMKSADDETSASQPEYVCVDLGDDHSSSQEKLKQKCVDTTEHPVDEAVVIDCNVSGPTSVIPSDATYLWTCAYRPQSSQQLVGNVGAFERFKSWLSHWNSDVGMAAAAAKKSRKTRERHRRSDSESSVDSDDCNGICNTLLLVGKTGSGKTATVYAIAEELGFKVFEVNASSQRSGKQIMTKLREATQSHHVIDKACGSPSNIGIQSFFTSGKGASPKTNDKTANDDASRSGIAPKSLILFEDVDIVLPVDDGFWNAVNSFMSTAKRPIVLTTSDLRFGTRGNIKGEFEEIRLEDVDFDSRFLHARLLCLAESRFLPTNSVRQTVARSSDFRKMLLELQFPMMGSATPSSTSNASEESSTLDSYRKSADFLSVLDSIPEIDHRKRLPWFRDAKLMDGISDQDDTTEPDYHGRTTDAEIRDTLLYLGHNLNDSLLSLEREAAIQKSEFVEGEVKSAVLKVLSNGPLLNSRTFHLDYLPCLRSICVAEETKQLTTTKRRGRFSHYLCSSVLYLDASTVGSLRKTSML